MVPLATWLLELMMIAAAALPVTDSASAIVAPINAGDGRRMRAAEIRTDRANGHDARLPFREERTSPSATSPDSPGPRTIVRRSQVAVVITAPPPVFEVGHRSETRFQVALGPPFVHSHRPR